MGTRVHLDVGREKRERLRDVGAAHSLFLLFLLFSPSKARSALARRRAGECQLERRSTPLAKKGGTCSRRRRRATRWDPRAPCKGPNEQRGAVLRRQPNVASVEAATRVKADFADSGRSCDRTQRGERKQKPGHSHAHYSTAENRCCTC